jgi:hypothetical protein
MHGDSRGSRNFRRGTAVPDVHVGAPCSMAPPGAAKTMPAPSCPSGWSSPARRVSSSRSGGVQRLATRAFTNRPRPRPRICRRVAVLRQRNPCVLRPSSELATRWCSNAGAVGSGAPTARPTTRTWHGHACAHQRFARPRATDDVALGPVATGVRATHGPVRWGKCADEVQSCAPPRASTQPEGEPGDDDQRDQLGGNGPRWEPTRLERSRWPGDAWLWTTPNGLVTGRPGIGGPRQMGPPRPAPPR